MADRAVLQKKNLSPSENINRASAKIGRVIEKYWKPGLYGGQYKDRSSLTKWKIPNDKEKWDIYHKMCKYSEDDIYNCASCGYGTCEGMALAIHNGLNKPENCHH